MSSLLAPQRWRWHQRRPLRQQPRRPLRPVVVMKTHSVRCGDARVTPHRVVITQREYKHDVAVAYVFMTKELSRRIKPKVPVSIRWGYRGWPMGRFHGYVHHLERWPLEPGMRAPAGTRRVKIVMAASSHRFKVRQPRLWKNLRASSIVFRLARQHYFAAASMPGLRLWRRLQQRREETTWEFLVRMAKASGCTFYAHNQTLFLYRRNKPPKYMRSYAPLFRTWMGEVHKLDVVEQHGDDITHHESRVVDRHWRRVRVVVTKAPRKNKGRRRDNPCAPVQGLYARKPRTTYPVITIDPDNQQDDVDAADDMNSWKISGTATFAGDPRVHQGSMIDLDDTGREYAGLWYVMSARHVITSRRYVVKTEIGRDYLLTDDDAFYRVPPPLVPDELPEAPQDDDAVSYDPPREDDDEPRPIYDPELPPPEDEPILVWPEPDEDPADEVPEDEDEPTGPGLPVDPEPPRPPEDGGDVGPLEGVTCPPQPFAVFPGEWRAAAVGPQSGRMLA